MPARIWNASSVIGRSSPNLWMSNRRIPDEKSHSTRSAIFFSSTGGMELLALLEAVLELFESLHRRVVRMTLCVFDPAYVRPVQVDELRKLRLSQIEPLPELSESARNLPSLFQRCSFH